MNTFERQIRILSIARALTMIIVVSCQTIKMFLYVCVCALIKIIRIERAATNDGSPIRHCAQHRIEFPDTDNQSVSNTYEIHFNRCCR